MADNARNYGFDSKIASWRPLGLTVPEMMEDKERTLSAILRESKAAIEEDFAECIVLGCGTMVGQAKKVQEELGVPVLDPILVGLKVAELRAMLWKRFGISHSKIGGYDAPPLEEFRSIYEKFYNQ